jgi:hypothetical protein
MRDPMTITDLALLEQPLIDIIHREFVKVCVAWRCPAVEKSKKFAQSRGKGRHRQALCLLP